MIQKELRETTIPIGSYEKYGSCLSSINYRLTFFMDEPMERMTIARPIRFIRQLPVIESDDDKGRLAAMTEVSDIGPTLQTPVELQAARNYFYQKDHIPAIWHQYLKTGKYPPFLFQQTSFINLFSADIIILFDLYRPPWKPYYTSDVFFYQWLKSWGSEINLNNLPLQFPGTIYVHNVTNQVSKHMLKEILNETTSDAYLIDQLMDARWSKLRTTPHLKTVMRILDTYNNLNSLRGRSAYYISGLKIYKRAELYHLKFNFTVAAGMPD